MQLNFSPFQPRKSSRRSPRSSLNWQPRYSTSLVQPFLLPSYLHHRLGIIVGNHTEAQQLSPRFSQGWTGSRSGMLRYLSDHDPKLVCLDLDFEQSYIERWADVCLGRDRPLYLRVPSCPTLMRERLAGLSWRIKRGCDGLAAVALLLLLSPLMLALALLIKLTSPGPVFFRQWRVGERGKLFRIFKFRTMSSDAAARHQEIMGNQRGLNKQTHDPRVTSLGHWLRKSSLDELPQLLNVLRGEMSLVGPRPWALYDAVQIRPEDRKRLRALPGITGLWQVSGRSKLLDIDTVTQLDLDYLRRWSLWSDFKILLMTLPSVLLAKGAC